LNRGWARTLLHLQQLFFQSFRILNLAAFTPTNEFLSGLETWTTAAPTDPDRQAVTKDLTSSWKFSRSYVLRPVLRATVGYSIYLEFFILGITLVFSWVLPLVLGLDAWVFSLHLQACSYRRFLDFLAYFCSFQSLCCNQRARLLENDHRSVELTSCLCRWLSFSPVKIRSTFPSTAAISF